MFSARVIEQIAKEVSASPDQVGRTIALLNSGNTIPFIARYRKDAVGGLDEVRIEAVEAQNHYFIALEQRRRAVLQNIEKLGQLTEPLRAAIEACVDKAALEDLYLPFKRKRQTRAALAVARGLAPLAEFIWSQGSGAPEDEAAKYVDPAKGVDTAADALLGAKDIIAERICEDSAARGTLRKRLTEQGVLRAHSTKASDGQKTKYSAFYDYSEPLVKVPAYRLLAILRGNREGALRIELSLDDEAAKAEIAGLFIRDAASLCAALVREISNDAFDRLLRPLIESEVMAEARRRADESAIRVFRDNVKSLLMAPAAGRIAVVGVDPDPKSGCKLAVVDAKSDFAAAETVHPEQGPEKRQKAREAFLALARAHGVRAVALGNGTGSREALAFVRECLANFGEGAPFVALVNEGGASVRSASKLASDEHSDLDATVRGAVSIARRLQDPLSELVKLEPRSIGVGQYQHDVNQKLLREGLHQTITQCVNTVGVDLNTASASLLRYVAGIQYGTAQNIVETRKQKGGFRSREELTEIPGVGPKTYEQAAGFLRISGGTNPLDNTAIHPEAYEAVGRMAAAVGAAAGDLLGNEPLVEKIQAEAFAGDTLGPLSVRDILKELARPGRDPRRRFRAAKFDENVRSVQDLSVGQELDGMVTNVTDFGAFVDLGAGQDGLVHLSELSHRYVKDPRRVVHVGESVRVKVIGIEKEPLRISLSVKALEKERPARRPARPEKSPVEGERKPREQARQPERNHTPREGGRAPGAREQGRTPTPDRRSDARHKDKKRQRPKREEAVPAKPLAPATPLLNTQLADQLEALRASLGIVS
jgi:uncharacterized protein